MKQIIIEALESPRKSGKFKEEGFVRGVLYGEGLEGAASVKFDATVIKNLISQHGTNAKVWVKYDGSKKFGLVKEVQIDPLSNKILHIDVQIIAKDQKMHLLVPVYFSGEESLKSNQLEFNIYKHEVSLTGEINLMPEYIEVDVSTLDAGDQITYEDLKLNKKLVTDDEEMVYGVVNHVKLITLEETEEEIANNESVEPAQVGKEE